MTRILFGSIAIVVYAFLGYPAAVALLARFRPRPVRGDGRLEPLVSLVITAYNEADVITAKLENAQQLDYPDDRLELIVVADGSNDETAELAQRFPRTTVLHEPDRRGKSAAMDRGVEAATGEIIVFSDANNMYTPDALRELVAPFADASVGMVTGRKAIARSGRPLDRAEGLYWRYESKLKEWEMRMGSVAAVAGEILAFRPSAYYALPPGTMNEDLVRAILAVGNGWRVAYAPNAISFERASATVADEATRRARLVTGRWQALLTFTGPMLLRDPQFAWQLLSHKGIRPLIPWALLAASVSNLGVARTRRWARALLALQTGFYGAALAGWAAERRGRRSVWLYAPYYFCYMNLAALRGLRDFVAGRRDVAWARVRRG